MMDESELPDLEELRRRRTDVRKRIEDLETQLRSALPEVEAKQVEAALKKANYELTAIGGELALLSEHAPMREASAAAHGGTPSNSRS